MHARSIRAISTITKTKLLFMGGFVLCYWNCSAESNVGRGSEKREFLPAYRQAGAAESSESASVENGGVLKELRRKVGASSIAKRRAISTILNINLIAESGFRFFSCYTTPVS